MSTRAGGVGTRVWTVPNVLSMIRLLLVPVFLVLVIEGEDVWALATLIFSSVTDFLDGWIARRFHQVTRLGQLLDPAADRLYILATLVGLAWREIIPWQLLVAIVARDLVLIVLGVIFANHGFGPLPVHHLGKFATFCLFYALPLMMLGQAFPAIGEYSQPVAWAFVLWGLFLYWWAGALYILQTVRVIRETVQVGPESSDTLEG